MCPGVGQLGLKNGPQISLLLIAAHLNEMSNFSNRLTYTVKNSSGLPGPSSMALPCSEYRDHLDSLVLSLLGLSGDLALKNKTNKNRILREPVPLLLHPSGGLCLDSGMVLLPSLPEAWILGLQLS